MPYDKSLKESLIEEKLKLKDMTLKKKLEYLWEYYKIPFIIIVAILFFIITFTRDYIKNSRPIFLDAAFINVDIVGYDDNTVKNDYIEYAKVDTDKYNLYFDTQFSIKDVEMDQMSIANMEKLAAMYAAQEFDLVVGPDYLMDQYGRSGAHAHIDKIFPKDFIDKLTAAGYELYITEEYDDLDNPKNISKYPAGIYLDNCEYFNTLDGFDAFTSIKNEGNRPVLTVAGCVKNIDNALLFIKMITGIE